MRVGKNFSSKPIYLKPSSRPTRLALYQLPSKGVVVSRRKTRLFWGKESRLGKVFFVLYLLISLLIAYAAISHASPPPSRGARPIALGNGYSAVSGDLYSLFYNPAGLYELNQEAYSADFGRSYSEGESARTDFNGLYGMPYRYKDQYVPLAFGVYADRPAPGAHIVDLTAGGGTDAPVDRWTKGFIKFPVKLGAAATIRQQHGFQISDRVGKSGVGLGLTLGAMVPVNKHNQIGASIRRLFVGNADTDGPSISFGVVHQHTDILHMFADIEYANKGIWNVHPGLEWLLARGVLRPRLGWGFHDNGGVDTVATGVGFYVSPMQIDIAYLIPVKTANDNAGQFRASLTYRFGRPQFSEIYYDKALEEASHLDQEVVTMSVKEAELKSSLAELEQKRKLANDELIQLKVRIQTLREKDVLGQRDEKIRQLQYRVKDLENQLSEHKGEIRQLREKKAEIRTHKVKPGDTLQSIAREYYGDPNQWKKIFNANPDKIERGLPKDGVDLIIP